MDREGNLLTPADVSQVTYSIHRYQNGQQVPEEGFIDVDIPVASVIFQTPEEDETLSGGLRNFRHVLPYEPPPFNEDNRRYLLDYKIYLANEELSAFTVEITTF